MRAKYFGYITVDHPIQTYSLKFDYETTKQIIKIKKGDYIKIRGLGKFKVKESYRNFNGSKSNPVMIYSFQVEGVA
jgi:hypothetical protein